MTPPLHLLIDGTNMAHRDFHAAGTERVRQIVSARIDAMRATWSPELILAAFDPSGPTFRHDLFDGYKAGRTKHEGTAEAIAEAQEALIDNAVPIVTVAGFEADDVVATFATRATAAGRRVLIYSADKDLHQLIDAGNVTQAVSLRRSGDRLAADYMTAAGLVERYGVRPDQWVEFRVMIGDKSDGIAGIDGVGPVAAVSVLRSFDDLDGYFAEPFRANISTNQQTKLLNGRRRVPMLRQLLTLRRDVPLGIGWPALEPAA